MSAIHRRFVLSRMAGALGLAGASYVLGPALALSPSRRGKLNFIFILVDDMGWTDLGCYGSRFYETPNIDKLAREGMRFTNAYVAAPVCSPSRASILTGKYPARLHLTDWIPGRKQWPTAKLLVPEFDQQLPLVELIIPQALKPAGYVSASIGKWHLGDQPFYPDKHGFDLNVAGTRRGSPVSYFGPFDLPGLQTSRSDEYLTDRLTDEALRFIADNKEKPFFLYLAHFTVHLPLQAKQDLVAKYERMAPVGGHHNPIYAAMIESLDTGVGRILNRLDELKLADNTVVFLTSDNGGLLYEGDRKETVTSNRPLRAGKGHLYEGGIREPLIVRWPGVVKPGTTCDVPVTSTDYFPTIVEMASVPRVPNQVADGVSILPLLKQSGALPQRALYWHYPHYSNQGGPPAGAIREGAYKLIEFYEDGHLELYNLEKDPGERSDLAATQPQKAAQLRQKLQEWRASVNAQMPKLNPQYDPVKADQGLTGTDPKNQ